MILTQFQLKSLRYDLQEVAHIEHTDVLNELFDHYATLTEQKMAAGSSFDEASKRAWNELGAESGLQRIQKKYVESIKSQIASEHVAILKSYFRWPLLMTTALVALLLFLVVPMIPVKSLLLCVVLMGLSPALLLGWGYFKSFDEQIPAGKIIWQYMQRKGLLGINLIQLGLGLPNGFFENGAQTTRTFLQSHPTISVAICLLTLLYTASFIELFHKKFQYKTA